VKELQMTATAAKQAAVETLSHWFGGAEVAGTSGRSGDVFNPSTGQVSAQVPYASLEELDRCVASAKSAFVSWAATPPLRRARVLFRSRQLLEAASEELA
jgi:malonate-semialdehyde dehydrogenase (acetylating) / methylmalonate-semialdehyde dehydrogenase